MLKAKLNYSLIMHISHVHDSLPLYGSQGYRTEVHFSAVLYLLRW